MGLGEEVKEKVEEVERKIIYDIVKELPLVPDQARGATDSRAYARVLSGQPSSAARPSAARARLRARLLRARPAAFAGARSVIRGGHTVVAQGVDCVAASQPRAHPAAHWARNLRFSATCRASALRAPLCKLAARPRRAIPARAHVQPFGC